MLSFKSAWYDLNENDSCKEDKLPIQKAMLKFTGNWIQKTFWMTFLLDLTVILPLLDMQNNSKVFVNGRLPPPKYSIKQIDECVISSLFSLSQFGKQWSQDSRQTKFNSNGGNDRQFGFASRVWATAVLRMELHSCEKVLNGQLISLLDPQWWSKWKDKGPNDRVFCKRDIVEYIYKEGSSLTYDNPILRDESTYPRPSIVEERIGNGISNFSAELLSKDIVKVIVDQ